MSSGESLGTPGFSSPHNSALITILNITDSGKLGMEGGTVECSLVETPPPRPARRAALPSQHHILFSELILCKLNQMYGPGETSKYQTFSPRPLFIPGRQLRVGADGRR